MARLTPPPQPLKKLLRIEVDDNETDDELDPNVAANDKAFHADATSSVPVVAIISGCGCKPKCKCAPYDVAKYEALRAVANNWPIIILEGSGGLADDLATYHRMRDENPEGLIQIDPVLAEIVERGNVNAVNVLEDVPIDVIRQLQFFATEPETEDFVVLKVIFYLSRKPCSYFSYSPCKFIKIS